MKRWKHVETDFDYKKVAEQVYLAAECDKFRYPEGEPEVTAQVHRI